MECHLVRVAQSQINFEEALRGAAGAEEAGCDEKVVEEKVVKRLKDEVSKFDVEHMVEEERTKLQRFDKNKNIIIKEIQSLKIYCTNKMDRAIRENVGVAQDADGKMQTINEEDLDILKDIIKKLDYYIDMIGTSLSHKISDFLTNCNLSSGNGPEGRTRSVHKGSFSKGGHNLSQSDIDVNTTDQGL